ncbi:hypothetical protein KIPB_000043 [Kipferlia bialata]|uniref:S-adenosyl-L-methionine-dependent methyltransferase n=1 Tax=Kipferlia bialata TaxID=797122 RepID=A0A9K3CNF5_9EUKA|nr:hypothetical protein KIPB_000043 [Kipferlia bialata]|eukprot:g43.t1
MLPSHVKPPPGLQPIIKAALAHVKVCEWRPEGWSDAVFQALRECRGRDRGKGTGNRKSRGSAPAKPVDAGATVPSGSEGKPGVRDLMRSRKRALRQVAEPSPQAKAVAEDREAYWRREVESQDFDKSLAARQGYVYAFAPYSAYAIAHMVRWRLESLVPNPTPFSRLVCVGGGPGSEALGVLAQQRLTQGEGAALPSVDVLDISTSWEGQGRQLLVDSGLASSVRYSRFDIFDTNITRHTEVIGAADMVVFSKVLSIAQYSTDPSANAFCAVLDTMAPGATLMVLDNAAGPSRLDPLCQCIRDRGFDAEVRQYPKPLKTEYVMPNRLRDYVPVTDQEGWAALYAEGGIKTLCTGALFEIVAVKRR